MFDKIYDFLKKVFGSFVGNLFAQAAKTTVGAMAEGLADIAAEVVKDMSSGVLTSDEKRSAAFTAVKNCAIAEGKEFTDHAINIAIELALALFKEGAQEITGAAAQ